MTRQVPLIKIKVPPSLLMADRAYEKVEPWHHQQLVSTFALLLKETLFNRRGKVSELTQQEAAMLFEGSDEITRGHFTQVFTGDTEIVIQHRKGWGAFDQMTLPLAKLISKKPADIVDAQIETYRAHTPSGRYVASMADVFSSPPAFV